MATVVHVDFDTYVIIFESCYKMLAVFPVLYTVSLELTLYLIIGTSYSLWVHTSFRSLFM